MDQKKLSVLESKAPDLVDDFKHIQRMSSRIHQMSEKTEIMARELYRLGKINKGDLRGQLFEKAHAPAERAWREMAAAKDEIKRLMRFYQTLVNCEAKKI